MRFIRSNLFGLAILACAAVSFSFPAAFTSWGGVRLTKLVTPAIQLIDSEGLSLREIAARFGVTYDVVKQVKSRLDRAVAAVERQMLK